MSDHSKIKGLKYSSWSTGDEKLMEKLLLIVIVLVLFINRLEIDPNHMKINLLL